MTAFFHSLRWRVQLWHGVILLVAVLAFCLVAYRLVWDSQLGHIDKSLARSERMLIHGLVTACRPVGEAAGPVSPELIIAQLRAGEVKLPADVVAGFQGVEPGYAYFGLYARAAVPLLVSDNAPPDLVGPRGSRELEDTFRMTGVRREMIRPGPPDLASVVGRDITPEIESQRRFAWSLGTLGLGVWLFGLLGGWWLAGRAIKPIDAISATASRIAAGNLTERIDTLGTDSELDQLGRVLNKTFDRLNETFEQQKRFTADASHELRTPVTILLSETQRILRRERTTAEYAEAIRTCHDTAERMRRLIEALLLLSRQDADGAGTPRAPCDLATVLAEAIAALESLATARGIRLHSDLHPAPCQADAAALSILAVNLVANAIQHHRADGNVHVFCGPGPGVVIFSVRDDGPGIPLKDQPYIFRRFYRVDQARTGSSGHTGLGLAIAKSIVDNHGGEIVVQSRPGEGTCFTVELPA